MAQLTFSSVFKENIPYLNIRTTKNYQKMKKVALLMYHSNCYPLAQIYMFGSNNLHYKFGLSLYPQEIKHSTYMK